MLFVSNISKQDRVSTKLLCTDTSEKRMEISIKLFFSDIFNYLYMNRMFQETTINRLKEENLLKINKNGSKIKTAGVAEVKNKMSETLTIETAKQSHGVLFFIKQLLKK